MPFRLDWDGHVHSEFCPHGSGEPACQSIERAIELGFRKISIVEHFPLPPEINPPPTMYPVAMDFDKVEPYLDAMLPLREEFSDRIEVAIGFEWDYFPDMVDWSREQMDRYGLLTQDGILSMHFMHGAIIDETADIFLRDALPLSSNSIDQAFRDYYSFLTDAVTCNMGEHKPVRLGHLNLIRRFNRLIPAPPESGEYRDEILKLAHAVEDADMQLDLNMSGLRREYCGEPFVPAWLIQMIARNELEIECVFGSDAHSVGQVGMGLDAAREIIDNA